MALSDEILDISQRAVSALNESHDYYYHSKSVWRLVQQLVREGRQFTFRNRTTGTRIEQRQLLERAQRYVTYYLMSATLQHFVSLFEDFFFDLLRSWLSADPRSLAGKQVNMRTVIDARDRDAIILAAVDKELNELKYQRMEKWFDFLRDLVKVRCPTDDEIGKLVELKATRDVLVHNSGTANKIYIAKAGKLARFSDGAQIEVSEQYHRESWELIKKVVGDLSNAVLAKASP
jgi:hypothetical protein